MNTKEAIKITTSFLNSVYPYFLRRHFFKRTFDHLQGLIQEKPEPNDPYAYGNNVGKDIKHFVNRVYPFYLRWYAFKKLLK